MKKIIALILLSIIVFVIVLCNYKPIVITYLSGNAIILEKVKNYTVIIDGNKYEEVLFRDNNKLILFLKSQNISKEYSIVSIEIKNNLVGYNCSSKKCYDIFLGYLFQSDMGKMFVPFDNKSKGPNFEANLKIDGDNIEFYIPKEENGKIHIQLNLQDSCT
ncbi:MAG: hypothetical protein L6Q46_08205 [Flavobacterium sp.]|uniref:hypothetical protein n=1 Tax=Flavobacterium sp. TaxID=239 RepID=UPI0025C0C92E|nr:hypothetical protein [Flavobacterium sp.]MCK6608272.1 hypothetical protein [Flavobacterium sp.]